MSWNAQQIANFDYLAKKFITSKPETLLFMQNAFSSEHSDYRVASIIMIFLAVCNRFTVMLIVLGFKVYFDIFKTNLTGYSRGQGHPVPVA